MCKDICKFILLVFYVNDLVQEIIQDDLDILTDNVNLAFLLYADDIVLDTEKESDL